MHSHNKKSTCMSLKCLSTMRSICISVSNTEGWMDLKSLSVKGVRAPAYTSSPCTNKETT